MLKMLKKESRMTTVQQAQKITVLEQLRRLKIENW